VARISRFVVEGEVALGELVMDVVLVAVTAAWHAAKLISAEDKSTAIRNLDLSKNVYFILYIHWSHIFSSTQSVDRSLIILEIHQSHQPISSLPTSSPCGIWEGRGDRSLCGFQ